MIDIPASRPARPAEPTDILLVVSVDTEEDNWAPARRGVTVENIRELPRLQRFLGGFGVRPTYFTNFQVLQHAWSREIVRELHGSGVAEIGGHLHPWNTPPTPEQLTWRNSMASNLSAELQRQKLAILTEQLRDVLGTAPSSFRAGRFALGRHLVGALAEQGYRVDSSVTPFMDWRPLGGPDFRGAPAGVYRIGPGSDPRRPVEDGPVLEIPVSSGFSRRPFPVWSRVHERLEAPWLRPFRATGLASRARVIRKIMLSPETDTVQDMLTLSRRLIEEGGRHLMLIFHSPSLQPGLTPFARTAAEVQTLYRSVGDYVDGLGRSYSVRFATATEAADELARLPARAV